jgi:hypothetical protein
MTIAMVSLNKNIARDATRKKNNNTRYGDAKASKKARS